MTLFFAIVWRLRSFMSLVWQQRPTVIDGHEHVHEVCRSPEKLKYSKVFSRRTSWIQLLSFQEENKLMQMKCLQALIVSFLFFNWLTQVVEIDFVVTDCKYGLHSAGYSGYKNTWIIWILKKTMENIPKVYSANYNYSNEQIYLYPDDIVIY